MERKITETSTFTNTFKSAYFEFDNGVVQEMQLDEARSLDTPEGTVTIPVSATLFHQLVTAFEDAPAYDGSAWPGRVRFLELLIEGLMRNRTDLAPIVLEAAERVVREQESAREVSP